MMARAQVSIPAPARSSVSAPADFRDFVMDVAKFRGLTTLAAIARAAGIDASSLSRWLDGHNGATVDSLRQLADALGVRLAEMLVAAGQVTAAEIGLEPLPQELQEVVAVLSREHTDQEKRALLRGIDYARQQWVAMVDELRYPPVEPRMRSRHAKG